MSETHILIIPAQELAVMQAAAEQSPQFAHFLKKLPCFAVSLRQPLANKINYVSQEADHAASVAQLNTDYPEDWNELREEAQGWITELTSLTTLQEKACSEHQLVEENPKACPCCGSTRYVTSQSSGDANYLSIPHLDFETEGGCIPRGFGIPTGGDGPSFKVCLDCGRIRNWEGNEKFPLTDEALRTRITEYEED